LAFALRKTIKRMSEQLLENPDDMQLMVKLETAAGLAKGLPFEVNIWRAQNNFYSMLQHLPDYVDRASRGDSQAQQWINHLLALGSNLSVSMRRVEQTQVQKAG